MFEVTVITGVSQGFNVKVDRIPVAGDFIQQGGNNYLVQSVYLSDGGGTNVFASVQASVRASSKASGGGKKTARSGSKKPGR
jgi:hypothetical protein